MTITLRRHQIEAADAVEEAFRQGVQRPLIDACVGSGKSLIFAELARREIARGGRAIICAHTRELVEQNAKACRMLMPGVHVGMNAAALGERTWRAPVISAAIQSVYRYPAQFGRITFLGGDESHLWPHSEAGMYRELVRGLGDCRVAGASGTVFRLQGGSLIEGEGAPFDKVVYRYSILDGIRDGYLCPAFSIGATEVVDASKLRTRNGDFTPESSDAQMLAAMDNHIAQMVHNGGQRRAWLVFEAGTKAATAMAQRMGEWGIPTGLVLGETAAHEREQSIRAYREGRLRALVNVMALTTGFDVPHVDLLVMRRPTKSLGLYIQQCLDAKTEVLSARGWLRHDQVRDDDEVAGFDQKTGAVEWCPILSRVARPLAASERMLGVQSPHLDIRVTDSHDMIVKGASGTCLHWKKESAAKVVMRQSLYRIPVAGVQRAGGATLSDDEIRLIGWYLTDGCINKKTNAMQIGQSNAKLAHCAEIRRVLVACGLKFGESLIARTGAQKQYAPSRVFYVSKGAARGRDKHLRGWAHLAAWFDKSLRHPVFELLDAQQVLVLIQAMWLGDGSNGFIPKDYQKRTFAITFGDNGGAAERMQSLCVRRGFRCNIAIHRHKPTAWNSAPKPQYMLYIKAQDVSTLPGVGVPNGSVSGKKPYQRSRFVEVPYTSGELVWCVENRLGTLIVRRNGKVAIVGNCGRGLRCVGGNIDASISAGKADCAVLDFAGNIERHGPLDFIRPMQSRVKMVSCEACAARVPQAAVKCWKCDATMLKLCPACLENIPKTALDCPACNFDMRTGPRGEAGPPKLRDVPSGAALISNWRGGAERAGGWLPVGRSWSLPDGGMLVEVQGTRHTLPPSLAGAIRGVAPRWLRVGAAGDVEAVLVPNGAARNSARQITATGAEIIVPMPAVQEVAGPAEAA